MQTNAEMQTDEFTAGTEAFLTWLSEVGVRINPKMIIEDLRSEGRGRGVGECLELFDFSILSFFPLRDLILRS